MTTIKFTLFGWRFYIADHALKERSAGSRNKAAERHLKRLQVARMMDEKGVLTCEICGENTNLQMHHLWAQSLYPEKASDQRNTILVCSTCHTRIHNDPFLWCDLIKQRESKADAIVANPPYKSELLNFAFE